jgi:hypothetical protein
MDITPGVKVACMGAFGYTLGMVAKTNPKITAITWIVAEAAIHIFKQVEAFKQNNLERSARVVLGSIACLYLDHQRLITKITQAVVSLAVFQLLSEVMTRLNIKLQLDLR